jgi:DNA-binding NtrC family response regulator
MPSRNDRDSARVEAGGESPQEPLIDRQLELDVLRQHIARVAETRRGHVVLILGESGVGKSRLAAEAGTEARKRGLTLISVRCLGARNPCFLSRKRLRAIWAVLPTRLGGR